MKTVSWDYTEHYPRALLGELRGLWRLLFGPKPKLFFLFLALNIVPTFSRALRHHVCAIPQKFNIAPHGRVKVWWCSKHCETTSLSEVPGWLPTDNSCLDGKLDAPYYFVCSCDGTRVNCVFLCLAPFLSVGRLLTASLTSFLCAIAWGADPLSSCLSCLHADSEQRPGMPGLQNQELFSALTLGCVLDLGDFFWPVHVFWAWHRVKGI